MSVFNRFNTELSKAFDNYVNTYLGSEGVAFTSPNKTAYDIAVNEAAARVPSETLEGTFPGMAGQVLGTASDIVMPAIALGSSPFYDMTQAASRARSKYGEPDVRSIVGDDEIPMGPSLPQYAKAVADENIIRSAIGRAAGAGKNLANRFSRIKDGIVANIPESIFTSAYAPEISEKDRQSIDITDKLNDYYEKGEMMDNVVDAPEDGIFAAFKDKIDPSTLLSFLANVYTGGTKQALTGTGIGKAFGNIRDAIGNRLGPASYGTSQAAFNALTPSQQRAVGSIYGPGGIMQGYNAVSAFGRGPIGSIQNRIDNILGRKAAQTAASRQKLADLKNALTNLGGDSDAGYSPGQDAGMGFGGGRSDPTDKS